MLTSYNEERAIGTEDRTPPVSHIQRPYLSDDGSWTVYFMRSDLLKFCSEHSLISFFTFLFIETWECFFVRHSGNLRYIKNLVNIVF